MTSKLFSPLKIRETLLKNRIIVSPMCMYSAIEGVANDWHLVHLGSRAVGGAGLVIVEATGVVMEGRISYGCLALENNIQRDAFKKITAFIKSQNSIPGIQLAHSGRKGEGEWDLYGPSARAFSDQYKTPRALLTKEVYAIADKFVHSAKLALEAGFEIIEAHMAHGYLMHQFLSPLSNFRTDEFGGTLENRMRLPLLVAKALRDFWPINKAVFVRISATDWTDGGWDLDQSIILCRELKKLGIDFIDVSTGGNIPKAKIPIVPGYQVEFATRIKNEVDILTGAVGMITNAKQAEEILVKEKADAVLLAREFLREPYWPIKAALELGEKPDFVKQYERAYL
ncbi:MAG: NADH:flavin oxidoreductase/NADH oxidase [Bacteriovorax sp.]|nr:NADH:flavin oxidoreductase/NADH oxidase [Bacteriovorax sp.]